MPISQLRRLRIAGRPRKARQRQASANTKALRIATDWHTLVNDRLTDYLYLANSAAGWIAEPKDIQSLESEGNYTHVTLSGGDDILIRKPFHVCQAKLEEFGGFFMVHRGYSVNLAKVKSITPYDTKRLIFHLSDGRSVIASREQSLALKRQFSF
jgi:DNA-binding LytR/AlgR family response regulator